MTQLRHKKLSMLLLCLLILLFGVAPTFADVTDNPIVVGDTFTKSITMRSEAYCMYNLNFETKGTYKLTISSNDNLAAVFADPLGYNDLGNIKIQPNTANSFDIVVPENMIDGDPVDYFITFMGFDLSNDFVDFTFSIEKVN